MLFIATWRRAGKAAGTIMAATINAQPFKARAPHGSVLVGFSRCMEWSMTVGRRHSRAGATLFAGDHGLLSG